MFSHSMDIPNGKYSYILKVPQRACINVFGNYHLEATLITGIHPNQTIIRPVTLAGQLDADGTYHGGTYSKLLCPYGTWTDITVLATIQIYKIIQPR
ncbi:hypothetical protein P5V15_012810 [Pogonomyrmex californicus]